MSTAQEVMMMIQAAEPHMDKLIAMFKVQQGHYIESGMVRLLGREVSAKRKRKLERRGDVIRFSRWTETGKCRYRWLPRIAVEWRL